MEQNAKNNDKENMLQVMGAIIIAIGIGGGVFISIQLNDLFGAYGIGYGVALTFACIFSGSILWGIGKIINLLEKILRSLS